MSLWCRFTEHPNSQKNTTIDVPCTLRALPLEELGGQVNQEAAVNQEWKKLTEALCAT